MLGQNLAGMGMNYWLVKSEPDAFSWDQQVANKVEPWTAEKGDWVCVDMQAVQPFPKPVSLATLKTDPRFQDLALVRLSRLSVAPVSAEHWKEICKMGGIKKAGAV